MKLDQLLAPSVGELSNVFATDSNSMKVVGVLVALFWPPL